METIVSRTKQRPILKWAGCKWQIVNEIIATLPNGKRLLEPFVGSAIVSYLAEYDAYQLSDSNNDLITLYKTLQKYGKNFISHAERLFYPDSNTAEHYYAMREAFNLCQDPIQRSALFIYLNRHGYNGLCRYNGSGQYNVPFGQYKQPTCPSDKLLNFYHKFKKATFLCRDFQVVMAAAKPGDVIYCDPPYVPLTDTAYFTSYTKNRFGPEEQVQLAELAKECAARGIPVLVSNHDTEFTRSIYKTASVKTVQVYRHISRNSNTRGKVAELLALFAPKKMAT